MHEPLAVGDGVVFTCNHRNVPVGVLDFTVANIRKYGDHSEIVGLHPLQKLLRCEHFLFIRSATANAAMHVGVARKPVGRLQSVSGLRLEKSGGWQAESHNSRQKQLHAAFNPDRALDLSLHSDDCGSTTKTRSFCESGPQRIKRF